MLSNEEQNIKHDHNVPILKQNAIYGLEKQGKGKKRKSC